MESKGTFGFQKLVSKFCNTERRTLLTTFVMGILIFVDDYLNVLSIGVCMKGVCDKRKIPREALAYMLDATGAPVCVLLPFSTWAVFYASLFIDQASVKVLGFKTVSRLISTRFRIAFIRSLPLLLFSSLRWVWCRSLVL